MRNIFFAMLLIASSPSFAQDKEYLYYFDSNLNITRADSAVFYGTGSYEDSLLRLMLYKSSDKHLIIIQHFTDSSLQVSDGLFSSYYSGGKKESEGNYTKGRQDGWWTKWDTTGNVTDSILYVNGDITTSTSYAYYPNHKIWFVQINGPNHKGRQIFYNSAGAVTKVDTTIVSDDEDRVFTKTEVDASFPGGDGAWVKYISRSIAAAADEFTNKDYGTCHIRFIVGKDGKVTDVEALDMKGSTLAKIAVNAIQKGPDWIPAQQNGRNVKAYRVQPVTVMKPD